MAAVKLTEAQMSTHSVVITFTAPRENVAHILNDIRDTLNDWGVRHEMTTGASAAFRKPTDAQRRYLQGFADGKRVLRPASEGGEFGDIGVVHRLACFGWIEQDGLTYRLTPAGRAALEASR